MSKAQRKPELIAPPLPKYESKRPIQVEVGIELFEAVHKELVKRNLKIREAVIWGLKFYLLKSNPKAAEELGITPEMKS